MRIVDAEDPNTMIDPELKDAQRFLNEARLVSSVEIDRIDILVLLGWILGVLDSPVGSMTELLGMVAYPRMIG